MLSPPNIEMAHVLRIANCTNKCYVVNCIYLASNGFPETLYSAIVIQHNIDIKTLLKNK